MLSVAVCFGNLALVAGVPDLGGAPTKWRCGGCLLGSFDGVILDGGRARVFIF